ncbi:MAG: MATE family efflux transporter [Oscillospiraceae bacterium]|nr:MATE family efflux transporter [Oscillospiraceae bacterium]
MKDLTKGSPIRLILLFALPILLGSVFQQAYSFTDTIIIGQQLGKDSIAAVGSTASVVSLMFNIINGMVTGFAIIVARNFGAGDHNEMRRTIARMMTFAGAAAAVIIVAIMLFVTPLLTLLDTPATIFEEAKTYLLIVAGGLVVTLIYNLEAGILRAVGDSVIPLVILVISAVLNIVLDLLFVCVFKWGVSGAAFATVLAQFISAVVCFIYLMKRRPFLKIRGADFVFTKETTNELLSAGLGMALMYSIVDIGSIVLQNGINGMGEDIIAAHTAARKIIGLMFMPFSAISATMVTYCSQNLGAGKYLRIKRGIRDGMLIAFGWSTVAMGLIYLCGGFLVWLILPEAEAHITDTALEYLRVNVLFFYPLAVLLGVRASLQGLGRSLVPIIASGIELVWKVLTVFIMIPWLGYFGVILSEPIIWTICGILIGIIAILTLRSFPQKDMDGPI